MIITFGNKRFKRGDCVIRTSFGYEGAQYGHTYTVSEVTECGNLKLVEFGGTIFGIDNFKLSNRKPEHIEREEVF